MDYKQGTSRDQLYLFNQCLDNLINENSYVRVIDIFVENLDMKNLGFVIPELKTGAPPYRNRLLLKIYIYGYLDRTRSSRRLERECTRNKEMIWLTEGLVPDFKTIANFRKNNRKGIKNIFKTFLQFCHKMDLLSLETVAIDGTKLRAQNSMNAIYKRDEIDTVRKKIQNRIDEYLTELDIEDEKELENLKVEDTDVKKIVDKLKKLTKHQHKVDEIKELFEQDKDLKTYYSTDPDSRFQSDKGKVRAGYNVQTVGDEKNYLIIATDVTNKSNDLEQMTPMVEKVKELKKELEMNNTTNVVMDAGYFCEKEIMNNIDHETIEIVVPDSREAEKSKKKYKPSSDKVPSEGFEISDFIYDKENDVFFCPDKKELNRTHTIPHTEKSGRKVFEYHCKKCDGCEKRDFCTKNKKGRTITVSTNKEFMDNFIKEMKTETKKKIIAKRKEIIEHPFGTLKRNLGYTYFMQKGLDKVKTEFSFMCFTYNFKRILNIFTVKELLEALK